jgi:AcrR family transcriptional regulator
VSRVKAGNGRREARGSRKEEQSRATQVRLLAAARALFSERGFAGTATEDLVARAGVTRGALYHQYADKKDLFRAVFEEVERDLGERIGLAAAVETTPWEQIRAGARALLEASLEPAVRRIVLTDGPSVLGWEEWRRIDSQYAYGMVRTALEANVQAGNLPEQPIEPLTHLIIGALNEAGLAVAASRTPATTRDEFLTTLDGVLGALRAAVPR